MKGSGNSFSTLFQKLHFMMIPSSTKRTKYIVKHRKQFRHIGDNLFWQPRQFPADPEYISIGDNVKISSNVVFVNHDIGHAVLNCKFNTSSFISKRGCISIGNNVMIGTGVILMPDIRIGSNVIIGAGAIVTKDIPDNSVVVGIPAKVIDTFDNFASKRKPIVRLSVDEMWDEFFEKH